MRTLPRACAAIALVAAGLAQPGCGSSSSAPGGLTLVVRSDLAFPKDLEWVTVEVRDDGKPLGGPNPLFSERFPIPTSDWKIPATLGIVNHHGDATPIAVRVTSGKGATARIQRDVFTTVPSDRNGELSVYLQWLSDGSADPTSPAACPAGQTNVAGTCTDAHVDGAALADYDPARVFGAATAQQGQAFDVLSCFDAPQPVAADPECTFAPPPGLSLDTLNVGFVLPPNGDGVCDQGRCVVELERLASAPAGALTGWTVAGDGRVHLPKGACAHAAQLVVSPGCPSKTPAMPVCGAWSAVASCSIKSAGGVGDAGPAPPRIELVLGNFHTCAIRNGTQQMFCWGRNDAGQIDTTGASPVLAPKATLSTVPADYGAGGENSTCVAVGGDGRIVCWGQDDYGQVDGTPIAGSLPPQTLGFVTTPTRAVTVSRGTGPQHACAIEPTDVACWGANGSGQCGLDTDGGTVRGTQVTVPNPGVLAAGDGFTCATSGGGVMCWGRNDLGQLGRGSTGAPTAVAAAVTGLSDITFIAAGAAFACALDGAGAVYCWGDNSRGQLGSLSPASSATPLKVAEFGANALVADRLVAGLQFACTHTGNAVYCWGDNQSAQIGTGPLTSIPTPTSVALGAPSPNRFDDLAAGGNHACAAFDGAVRCWGDNTFRQVSGASATTLPATVVSLPP